jgi:aryl-alcohol dehydrogenase-like predicted oxidoreductase
VITAHLSDRLPDVSRIAVGSLTVSKMQAALPADEAAAVLAYAFDSGINFTDTAQYYENYDLLRAALLRCRRPEDVILSTKTYAYSRVPYKSQFIGTK